MSLKRRIVATDLESGEVLADVTVTLGSAKRLRKRDKRPVYNEHALKVAELREKHPAAHIVCWEA